MKNNTIVRSLSRSKFIKRHLILTMLSVLAYVGMFSDVHVLVYMLLGLFSPWILLVYEAVIITGRLHDINKPVILTAFVYLKVELFLSFMKSQFTYREIIFASAYVLFIAILYIKKPNEKISNSEIQPH